MEAFVVVYMIYINMPYVISTVICFVSGVKFAKSGESKGKWFWLALAIISLITGIIFNLSVTDQAGIGVLATLVVFIAGLIVSAVRNKKRKNLESQEK